jgi:acetyl-CoA decarbonylase/synthase complex subunit delta
VERITEGGELAEREPGKMANGTRELLEIVSLFSRLDRIELENVSFEIGDLDLFLPVGGTIPQGIDLAMKRPARPTEILTEPFTPVSDTYPGKIREVTLGATPSRGGSRGCAITIGGADYPAFFSREHPPVHTPPISIDVFDMVLPLPGALKKPVLEVLHDPAEWAKMNVREFGADMVTVHLMSTDPLIHDRSPREASKTIEDVLQAVDVPLIIGGCGHPRKDAEVFSEVAEMAAGERLLLNSVTLDMVETKTLGTVASAAARHDHVLLAFTGLELNNAKELNRRLYEYIAPENMVMDLTTVALGYGLEYSFSIHERARVAALNGDAELQHPTISASTNAWAAREAWMSMDPAFGEKAIRGPLWETMNGLILLLAGVDIFMMMHPSAVHTMRETIRFLTEKADILPESMESWVTMRG